jgi:hypothetical protein
MQQGAQPCQPGPTTPGTPSGQPAAPTTEPILGAEQAAATGGDTVALAAPNMIGNLLGAGRSASFFYQRSSGSVFINGTGATNLVNAHVADNNSPVPEDRLYFRYNYFSNGLKVTGDSGQAVFDPSLGVSAITSAPRFRGITMTKDYDVDDFTFGGEKTFLDKRFSVEMRIPFSYTLSHDLNLSVANVTGIVPDTDEPGNPHSNIKTAATPENSLGNYGTEFGNMTVILKGLAYQSCNWAVSGGLSIGIPTAPSTHVRVTDFLGDQSDNDIEVQRVRDFHVSNDTWSLSPFLAALWTPSERFFAQSFLQFDLPLNRSTIHYSEAPVINTEPFELGFTPLNVTDKIREQSLMQVDLGIGYWILKDPQRSWITGVAPTLELHYTTTLENADIRYLPVASKAFGLEVVGPNGVPIPEPNPTVGNLRNRVDLLDMTVGTTLLLGNRTTLAAAVSFPLKNGDNRTFDWEFQFQFNYYFGGGATRRNFAPPSF